MIVREQVVDVYHEQSECGCECECVCRSPVQVLRSTTLLRGNEVASVVTVEKKLKVTKNGDETRGTRDLEVNKVY